MLELFIVALIISNICDKLSVLLLLGTVVWAPAVFFETMQQVCNSAENEIVPIRKLRKLGGRLFLVGFLFWLVPSPGQVATVGSGYLVLTNPTVNKVVDHIVKEYVPETKKGR